jgi:phage tail sheath protein FI
MGFQLSPGVEVSEIDLTTIVPAVATSIGAIAGVFAWGPVNEVVTISDEVRLADRFGKPNNTNYEYWFTAANFLSYSNNLKVVRAANTDTTTASGTYFTARYPGELGNSIRVEVADSNTFSGWTSTIGNNSSFDLTREFTDEPANNELHIVVIDEEGKFSGGLANTILEKYAFVSIDETAKTFNGSSNYYVNVLDGRSKFILADTNTTIDALLAQRVNEKMSGGDDGVIGDDDIIAAYDMFKNGDVVDVSLIMTGPGNQTTVTHVIDNIAEFRKDCVVFVSPERSDVVDNYGDELTDTIAYRNSLTSTSYAVMDSNWKYQFDKYNDVYRWVPLNGDIAGLAARTDRDRDPWYSPAGLNRGIIKNVIKLAWNPNKTDRDELYVKGINPVVTFAGEGTILYGDKTLLSRPSAFDRINVRRLFIVLEKAIARAARSSLFEFNDTFTRAQFVNLVEPFLRDVQGRRGITDFRVVCDETNNTGEVIDRNEFIGDIYIKPARSINFIQLNFVAVRTGVSFDEVVGKFG